MRKFDNINVIPFIDILLVLLAIVLTTATFISHGQLDIALPAASTTDGSLVADKIEIAIDRDHRIFLNGIMQEITSLQSALSQVEKNSSITLIVDRQVEFGQFVGVLDILKTLSLDQVSIVTRTVN